MGPDLPPRAALCCSCGKAVVSPGFLQGPSVLAAKFLGMVCPLALAPIERAGRGGPSMGTGANWLAG